MSFIDNLKTLEFTSRYDDSKRCLLISMPLSFKEDRSYPLIISPHPFGWSDFENFSSGAADLVFPFKGWKGIAEKYGIIIALPLGHGRVFEKISLAWEAQLKDLVTIPEVLDGAGIKINGNRIFISGLSMGGIETITAMGKYPGFFKAGFSFNGISDLETWYFDVKNGDCHPKLKDADILNPVRVEIGGSPEEVPEEYKKRSGINYIDDLLNAELMVYWSGKDTLVPNQDKKQSKRLYDLIKSKNPSANIYEHDHTNDHGFEKFDDEECLKCHEYNDFDLAAKWFMDNY